MPEPRYFSIPSTELGAEVLRNRALNGGNDGGVADHGHQITVPARFRSEDAKAVLGIVEGYPLDEAGEHLLGR
jgi:hypothetical protein